MDGTVEPRATRASKRRRVSPPPRPQQPSPTVQSNRSISPDPLHSGSPSSAAISRNASTPTLPQHPMHTEPRRPSFSPVSDSSPDELDHTANTTAHTFYRTNEPYRQTSFSERARRLPPAPNGTLMEGRLAPPSPRTPEYSRISTPIHSPAPPGKEVVSKEARFVGYKVVKVLRGHKRGVAAVRFSPDGRLIASCSADSTIRIWDASTGKCLQVLEGHLAGISAIAWAPDSETIASGSDDKSIRLWNVTTGKPHPHPLHGHHHYIYALAFSPKGNILVSGSYDEAVILWDVRTRQKLRTLPAHSDPVGGVDFVRDGTLIVSCAGDGLIRIWDTGTGQCLRTLVHEDNAPVVSVRFSPNGKFVLAWTLDACVRLWNYVEGRCVKTYQGHENNKFSMGGAFGVYGGEDEETAKKAFVVSGSEDGKLVWWDVVSKDVLGDVGGHEGVCLGVDTREEGRLVVSCGIDKTMKIWEREEGADDIKVEGDDAEVKEETVDVPMVNGGGGDHAKENGDAHLNGQREIDG